MGRAANAIAWTAGAAAVVGVLASLGGGRRGAARRAPPSMPAPAAPRRRGAAPPTMAPDVRPAARTAFAGPEDFIRRVSAAYQAAGAPRDVATLLTAHSGLATGFGRNVWGANIGVLRAGPTYAGPTMRLSTREWAGTGYRRELASWRAYDSLADSARDVVRLLGAPRYREARGLLEAGDVGWFAALGRAGYYTEPVDRHAPRYARALRVVRGVLA